MAKKKLGRVIVKAFSEPDAANEVALILRDALRQAGPKVFEALTAGVSREEMIKRIAAISDRAGAYAETYVDTGLSIIGRERIADTAKGLGLTWFRYIGGVIQTSREFCVERDGGFYHETEIKDWVKDEAPWDGMIEGTDEENIFAFCGGWNCRHDLVPVSELVVPKEYLDRLDEDQNTEEEEEELVEEIPADNITREPATEIIRTPQEELDKLYDDELKKVLEVKPIDNSYVDAGIDLGLTKNDVTVVNYYTGENYGNINAFTRGEVLGEYGAEGSKFYEAYVEHLNQSLNKIPESQYKQLYRWETFNEDRWKLYTSNKDLQMDAFYSTAQTKTSSFFDGGFNSQSQKLRVYVEPKVSGSSAKSIADISNMPEEYEVLFPTKSRFKVIKHSLETKQLWLKEL